MYRVVLVEDEAAVREGIVRKISWEEHGFRLAGVFENGRQALAAIRAEPVDVVITDINMPVMDGLELAGELHRGWPDTLVVLLTGYDDFTYAQTAIRHKVHSYILKPITARQLRQLLDQLHGELRQRDAAAGSREGLELAKELVRRQQFEQLIQGGYTDAAFAEKRGEFFPDLQDTVCCAGLFGVLVAGEDDAEARDCAADMIREALSGESAQWTQLDQGRIAVVFCSRENPVGKLRDMAGRLCGACGYPLSAVVGPEAAGPAWVGDSYQRAMQAFQHLYRLPVGRSYLADELPARDAAEPKTSHLRRAVVTAVRLLDGEQALEQLQLFVETLAESALTMDECIQRLQKLIVFLEETADTEGLSDALRENAGILEEITQLPSLSLAHGRIRDYVAALIAAGLHDKNSAERQAAQAVEYIHKNYADPAISLQRITAHLSVSVSHFSNLFKSHTGVTFVEYLTRLRMERAQELLVSTDKKNYEIASLVGYDDPGYFSSSFKKFTGMKPSEYRRAHPGQPGVRK